jgi:hypothetical protein
MLTCMAASAKKFSAKLILRSILKASMFQNFWYMRRALVCADLGPGTLATSASWIHWSSGSSAAASPSSSAAASPSSSSSSVSSSCEDASASSGGGTRRRRGVFRCLLYLRGGTPAHTHVTHTHITHTSHTHHTHICHTLSHTHKYIVSHTQTHKHTHTHKNGLPRGSAN